MTGVFRELADALLKYQQPNGMWYQVADRPEAEKNYPETSGSSIIAYGLAKAVSMGILGPNTRRRRKRPSSVSAGSTCTRTRPGRCVWGNLPCRRPGRGAEA